MKKEIKFGAVLGYVNMLINILVTLIYTPFLIRMLGQSEYGLYSLVSSVIAYLSVLDMGFGNAMIRFISRSHAKNDNQESKINGMFLFLYSVIGVISIIIGVLLIKNTGAIFSNSLTTLEIEKAKILMMILVFNVSLSFPLSVFDSYIIANEKFIYSKLITILRTILKPLIMLPLLFFGYKSITLTIVITTINLLGHLAMLIYCIKILKIKVSFSFKNFDKSLMKEISFYSFFIFLNIIVDNLFHNTDQVILGIVSGTIAVSIYSVATQIINMNTQFSTIISSLFFPKITKVLEDVDANKKLSDLFLKVSRIQLYIMTLIMFGFFVFGKFFIELWVGLEYIEAYYIILIIITPSIVPLTQNLAISILQAKNKHQFRSIVYIIIAIANVFISIPLAKAYGGIGAAIGTALATLCGQIITMNIYYYKKINLDIPKYWCFLIKFLLQILIFSVVFVMLLNNINLTIYKYCILIVMYVIIYFTLVYINMNEYEKNLLLSFLNKFRRKIK